LLHKKELNAQTLLLSINGTIGNVAFYCGEKVMLGKSAAYLNFLNTVNIEYVKLFLESSVFKNYYELELSGSTINNFSLYSIGKTPIVLPTSNEQIEIVKYIKSSFLKITTAITLKQQEIEKLKEYKATLINSAVTGKIKVV
jgi:type I restriction enzyme S subunit